MESMRDIRMRAKSVEETLKVTTAMKLISTAKLRKARLRLEETLPYFDSIRAAMHDIVGRGAVGSSPWFDLRTSKGARRAAVLVVTSDRGLAGGFNTAIVRFVEERCPPGTVLLPIGAVGKRYFMERDYVLLEDFPAPPKEPTVYEAGDITTLVCELFLAGRIDEFRVAYTRLDSVVRQTPEMIELLPLRPERLEGAPRGRFSATGFSYLPDAESVLDLLVPRYLRGVIYGALVGSFASEQAARMRAMDSASKNAKEMLDRLRLLYNRARQASITGEVSEIVAGAAAIG